MTYNRVVADLPRSARDHAQQPLPAELRPLMSRMISMYRPLQVWLFGSRARKKFNLQSDWDLLIVVADDAPEELLDPIFGWRLQRDSGVYADIVCARQQEFIADIGIANTLVREVERDGVLLYAA